MDTIFPRTVELLLATRSPMVVATGPELLTRHNEAYACLMLDAGRSPLDVMPLRELSPELWERAGPLILQAMLGGQSAVLPDQLFCISRNGCANETYLTIACDPVIDGGRCTGVMISLTETTEHVVGARRTATLREVATASAGARSVADACHRALDALSRHSRDVPFALIYLVGDAERGEARLVASTALPAGTAASAAIIPIRSSQERRSWPLAAAIEKKGAVVVEDLLTRFGPLPGGDWPFAPRTAVVMPLAAPGRQRADCVLVAGISARHALDDATLDFIDLLAKQIAAGIAGGQLREDEERNAAARAKRRARVRAMKERFAGVLEERTRLAREIHDTLLQGVTGISLNLQAVLPQVRTSPTAALEALERIAELAAQTSREARRAVWDIRPQALKGRELVRAIESVARLALGESTLSLRVTMEGRPRRVRADVQGTVLRIVQEAVANVARHAAARTVRITLRFQKARLRVSVVDDGRGFTVHPDFTSYTGHWGLLGMQERARQFGASLHVRSAPGRGTAVILDAPTSAVRRSSRRAA
ncbi:MAG TPA: GAF domain-containing sensor histidine kinase [Gemmatimonadaceae bacterium]|nr:GAF domain-containing sensor histidine kinase [Gemmatimonadaceae bacterium]